MKTVFFRACMILLVFCLLSGCNLPTGSPAPTIDFVATQVQATLTGLARQASLTPQASSTTVPPTASATASITPSLTFTPSVSITPSPSFTLSPSFTITIGATKTPKPGSIAGAITGYPYGSVPRLAIVAFDQKTTYLMYWYWITAAGQTYYMMDAYILPSTYQVVAYDASGHAGGCTSLVTVKSNQTVTCNITDWGGSYPSKPAKVPIP